MPGIIKNEIAWLLVEKAQRDVPMHIAAEYCRNDRSFEPLPSFHEKTLPRELKFDNYVSKVRTWFPLCGEAKGLGYDFALGRQGRRAPWCWGVAGRPARSVWAAAIDLGAVRHLIQVRTEDLSQSRKNLQTQLKK
jgi:hypothetical protein